MIKKLFAFIVLLVVVASAFYFYRAAKVVVEVSAARRGTATSTVYGTVKVTPVVNFSIHARAGGVLKYTDALATNANLIGVSVKTGQLLGEIFNETLDHDFAKASAELETAKARQKLGPAGLPALKNQEDTVARYEKLAQSNNIAPSDFQHATNDLVTARETVRQQQIEIEHEFAIATQEYGNLKEQKERCQLISPIDGLIQAFNGANGEFVSEGSVPFAVASTNTFLEGQVNEEDIGRVAARMKASVKLYAYPDRELSATVTQILPSANDQRYTVNLNLDQPPDNLMAGETGEMNIISGTRENALIIPTRALLMDRVWIVVDGVVKPRSVKVGYRNLQHAEILDGLHEGDEVVVADQDLLRPGLSVRVVSIDK